MSKIAIIADIHGNKEALETALKNIKERDCDKIICLGDVISKGKFSNECVELVKNNCDLVLRGNCDDFFTKEHNIENLNVQDKQRVLKYRKELSTENKEYLSHLPFCYEFYLSGRLVRTFHAGPDTIYNYSNTSMYAAIDKKYKMFEPNILTLSDSIADIVVYGHIHTQLMNKIYNRTLICCGSIGNNLDYIRNDSKDGNILNTTCVNYVILEGNLNSKKYSDIHIDFVQVQYNIDKELNASKNMNESDSLYYELKHGKYRDSKKINNILINNGIDIDTI